MSSILSIYMRTYFFALIQGSSSMLDKITTSSTGSVSSDIWCSSFWVSSSSSAMFEPVSDCMRCHSRPNMRVVSLYSIAFPSQRNSDRTDLIVIARPVRPKLVISIDCSYSCLNPSRSISTRAQLASDNTILTNSSHRLVQDHL